MVSAVNDAGRNAHRPTRRRLTAAQRWLWYVHRLNPESAAYNVRVAYRLRGPLQLQPFGHAVNELMRRHEKLRARFEEVEGEPFEWISQPGPFAVDVVDLRGIESKDRFGEAIKNASAAAEQAFDLEAGPPLRIGLWLVEDDDAVLLIAAHHIVLDARSLSIVLSELAELYAAYRYRRPPVLGPLAPGARSAGEEDIAEDIDYWAERLAGVPQALDSMTDKVRPAIQTFRGATESACLPADVVSGLRALARRSRATMFMAFLAAFAALLERYSNAGTVVIGAPMTSPDVDEHAVGAAVDLLPLRVDVDRTLTFAQLLEHVRSECLSAYEHGRASFVDVVRRLKPARDASRQPIFQVMLTLIDGRSTVLSLAGLDVEKVRLDDSTARLDMMLTIVDFADDVRLDLEYNTDLFEAATIRFFLRHLRTFIAAAVGEPNSPLSAISIVDTDERHALQRTWNATASGRSSGACVHHLFQDQVRMRPEDVAVSDGRESLTYGELETRARAVAEMLIGQGIRAEDRVAVCAARGVDLVAAMLGVMEVGAAYVALDPHYPRRRLEAMLSDAQIAALLADEVGRSAIDGWGQPVVDLAEVCSKVTQAGSFSPVPVGARTRGHPESLAYVAYTSGSTGTPKGVLVQHRSVVNVLESLATALGVSETDVWLSTTTLSFDMSVPEVFLPLAVGGKVVLAPTELAADPIALQQSIIERRATILQGTPGMWRGLLEISPAVRLRAALCGGEAIPPEVAAGIAGLAERAVGLYGPTETTVWSTVTALGATDRRHPIGLPLANTEAYVIADDDLAPTGLPGELWLGGIGVARGYLGRPAETAERFRPDAFGHTPGQRLYMTGDLVRRHGNGQLEFCGRVDQQVKVRGFRIEPAEVEAAIAQCVAVREVVVIAREERPGQRRLVAYLATDGPTPCAPELRAELSHVLPEYMIPTTFVVMRELPRTQTGKIDRTALPAPNIDGNVDLVGGAPRTALERLLVSIWCDALDLEAVGVHDNFFELGGDSLASVRIVARADQAGVSLRPRDLFVEQTVSSLAAALEAKTADSLVEAT